MIKKSLLLLVTFSMFFSITIFCADSFDSTSALVPCSPDGRYLIVGDTKIDEELTIFRGIVDIDGSAQVYSFYNNFPFNDGGSADGDVIFENGFTVGEGQTLLLKLRTRVGGKINLNDSATIELESDLHLGSDAYFYSGGKICGNGNILFLSNDFTTSSNSIIHISGDTIIDGQHNDLKLGEWSQIFVDTNVTLTLKNLTLKNTKNNQGFPPIRLAAHGSKLALDNAILCPSQDFYFLEGQLFIHNDVVFTGTHRFIYQSTQPSYITSQATWHFEPNTTFLYDTASSYSTDVNIPSSTLHKPLQDELIQMEDGTSSLWLNKCTLQMSHSGLRLSKGIMFIDNYVIIKNDETDYFSSLITLTNAHHGSGAYAVDWSPDGKYFSVGGAHGSADVIVYEFDGSSLTQKYVKDHGSYAWRLSWSPDGKYLAVAGDYGTQDIIVYGWNGSTLTITDSRHHGSGSFAVGWSPDGNYLAVGGDNGTNDVIIYEFDGSSLTQKHSKAHGSGAYAVDWSPDGRYLAVGGDYGTNDLIIYSWNGSTLTLTASVYPGNGTAYSVDWSPDGRYLALGGDHVVTVGAVPVKRQVIIYELNGSTLTLKDTENVGPGATVFAVDWGLDGRYLAVGGNYSSEDVIVYEWNGSTLTKKATESHGSAAYSVAWSPDCSYLGVGGINTLQDVIIYNVDYTTDYYEPSYDNGFIIGDSSKGSDYDLDIFMLGGAKLEIRGTVYYDNV